MSQIVRCSRLAFLALLTTVLSAQGRDPCLNARRAVAERLTPQNACSLGEDGIRAIAKAMYDVSATACRSQFANISYEADLASLQAERNRFCKEEKKDSLPRFEATLQAMTDGRQLDPCTYDPTKDYSAILAHPGYQNFATKTAYDNGVTFSRFRLYARKECFLDFIEAFLKGQQWTPRKPPLPPGGK